MRALSASELLRVWERGLSAGPLRRAQELLAAACPESNREGIQSLSIGQRDALLLRLREWTFGRELIGIWLCPACGERIELACAASDFLLSDARPLACVDLEGYHLELRPPNSADLEAVTDHDLSLARLRLLERCLVTANDQGGAVEASRLPDAVLDEAEKQLAAADPQADIQFVLACPNCGARHRAAFDIVSFFWREIESWAVRILREVHTLASAYGWGEEEILALSPVRRQCYLDLAGA